MAKNDILSYGTIGEVKQHGGRHIVALSGGIASAWVAWWVKNNIEGDRVYYFNDTNWEHPDLYRFLNDLEKKLDIKITRDNDGRTPEQVFYDVRMLGSNRTPICSRILKAERLQRFVNEGETVYFGIDLKEYHRAARIGPIYARLGVECKFPLIDEMVSKDDTFKLIDSLGIEIPQMYKDGFTHNNCAGGCVRAGKKQWASLIRVYPEIYAERERVEKEFSKFIGKPYTYMKDMSLEELRAVIESQGELDFEEDEWQGECVGICGRMF
jgi:3'-phosphoadenosine 5'-phosphosulfate sulfotransferase (PAPS reductase)/FAD synthetase